MMPIIDGVKKIEGEMRYPAELTADRHERILEAAARLVREQGFAKVGVAQVMKEAGLTHGAFYAHFDSKEAMIAAALDRALRDMVDVAGRASAGASDPLAAFASAYLTVKHRDNPGHGCAMATLGPEVFRQGAEARRSFTERLQNLFSCFTRRGSNDERSEIIRGMSTLVGAMVLARAVDDKELSSEILAAASHHLRRKDAS
jgi:TetR/AcrR family transcriptional repressor of nem operon